MRHINFMMSKMTKSPYNRIKIEPGNMFKNSLQWFAKVAQKYAQFFIIFTYLEFSLYMRIISVIFYRNGGAEVGQNLMKAYIYISSFKKSIHEFKLHSRTFISVKIYPDYFFFYQNFFWKSLPKKLKISWGFA